MPDVVGIRFKNCGKIYDFEVNGIEVAKGDIVVVESELGLSMGNVVVGRHSLEGVTKELKKVLRKATDDDLRQKTENRGLEEEAMAYCIERVMARGLPMKMICTEVTLDKKRFIFYFTADGRIDFRELVKDLAARFKTRIEMRQVGVRDAAKTVGGIGICGRELCCRTFLTSFEPISIRMAKSQELVLNANKLSGVCGRLMCCLSYEYSDIDMASEEVVRAEDAGEPFEQGGPATAGPREKPFLPEGETSGEPLKERTGESVDEHGTSPGRGPGDLERPSGAGPREKSGPDQDRSGLPDKAAPEGPDAIKGEKGGRGSKHRHKRRHKRRFHK